MPVVEVTNSTLGLLGYVATVADGERILVHVRHVANTGVSTSLLFLLDLTGAVVARQTVPLRSPGGRVELALTGSGSAALAVSTRDPSHARREGIAPSDVHHRFRVEWPNDRIKVTPLSSWMHGQICTAPPKLRLRDGIALTLCSVTTARSPWPTLTSTISSCSS